MKKLNNKLLDLKKYFIIVFPAVLFFSYHPLILLDSNDLMNFELSLPLVWLLLFSIISVPSALLFLKTNFKKKKWPTLISLLFPFYSSLTIFWSLNPLRTLLTSGVMWCIWLSIISIFDFYKKEKLSKKTILKIFYPSTIAICTVCWIQCVLDIIGVQRDITLLCSGCTNYSFGFPHPNGFAIEPQFMGNLLLAPAFLSLYQLLKTKEKHQKLFLEISSFFILATLFLTMSRGAIYAFCVGLVVFLFLVIKNKKSFRPLFLIPLIFVSFLFTLVFQGIFAEISPTNDTFKSGISKVLNQMSLGKIDIPYELKTAKEENEIEDNSSQFDGYAEISTTTRLDFQKLALRTWTSSLTNFIFGVGTGSAGKAMHAISPKTSGEKEIVQNEILEIAVELGLVGVIILIISLVALIKFTLKSTYKNLLLPLLVAYFISYLFFSGLPNAIHIYLLPALIFANKK